MNGKISAEMRRDEISRLVADLGFVRVDDLAERFAVTPMTIHRDLDTLDERGILSKVRSGARVTQMEERERNVSFREFHMVSEKAAIAREALAWLRAQPTVRVVSVDDSTTVLAMVDGLVQQQGISIVTNFLPAVQRAAEAESANLSVLGGNYVPEFQSFQGHVTLDAIEAIQIDVAFMSVPAVGERAVFHQSEGPLLVRRAVIENAHTNVLLVDHTKFLRRAAHRQAKLADFDVAIVDDGVEPEHLRALEDHIPTVIVATTDRGEDTA